MAIPPQIGEGRSSIGNTTRIMSTGTTTKPTRDSCSSPTDRYKCCKVTWVSRARNWSCPVTSRLKTPSARSAASKSSSSLKTDVTLPDIFLHQSASIPAWQFPRLLPDEFRSVSVVWLCNFGRKIGDDR
jgi:hypothetical protein